MEMHSMQQYFAAMKAERDEKSSGNTASIAECTDFDQTSKINDEWNQHVAEIRLARQVKERANEEARILQDIEQRDAERAEQRRRTNELVRMEKVRISIFQNIQNRFFFLVDSDRFYCSFWNKLQEAAKAFIVRENIDQAIEHALNNVKDYNFAIDSRGQIYSGRVNAKESNSNDQQTEQADSR